MQGKVVGWISMDILVEKRRFDSAGRNVVLLISLTLKRQQIYQETRLAMCNRMPR